MISADGCDGIRAKAYGIFKSELERHMADVRPLIQPAVLADQHVRQDLQIRFHTIKGGAGFFGLSEIASLTGILQSYFATEQRYAGQEINYITSMFEKLTKLIASIPDELTQIPEK